MKYFFSLLLSIAIIPVATAQDFKKVQTSVLLKRYEDAKTELGKALANPKNQDKAEGFYWKSRIYAALYKDTLTRLKYSNLMNEANDAFDKYIKLDSTFSIVLKEGADGYFDMYVTNFSNGQTEYNKNNFEEAAVQFKNAVIFSDYIFKNNWASVKQPFDTLTIQYCASSFFRSGNESEGIKYYSRLADAKLTNSIYIDVYRTVLQYFTKNKNKDEFDKYLKLSSELFPSEKWEEFELEYIEKNYDLEGKTKLYDELDAAGTLTENTYFDFGSIFSNARNEDGFDSAKLEKYIFKSLDAFKKAFDKNNNNSIASFNVGIAYYNLFNTEDDKFRSNLKLLQELNTSISAIKDPKKKIALENELKGKVLGIKNNNSIIEKGAIEKADLAIEWFTKSFIILKDKLNRTKIERSVINSSVDRIATLYEYKMNRVRGKDAKLFDQFEIKFKEFDALHSKF